MTKELTALSILTEIVLLSWAGWLFFERDSVLTQTDFSQKTVQTLNPVLDLEVLE